MNRGRGPDKRATSRDPRVHSVYDLDHARILGARRALEVVSEDPFLCICPREKNTAVDVIGDNKRREYLIFVPCILAQQQAGGLEQLAKPFAW
jgi:hypothetical protein